MKKVNKIIAGILLTTTVFSSGIALPVSAEKDKPKPCLEQIAPNEIDKANRAWTNAEKTNSEDDWKLASEAWNKVA